MPRYSSSPIARSVAAAPSRWTSRPRSVPCRSWAAISMFSKTVISGKSWMSWNVRAMPRRYTASALSPVMSSSLKRTRPPDGRSTPVTQLNSVVLPDPFGPMIPRSSPRSTPTLTRLRAENLKKCFVRSWISRSGMRSAASARPRRRQPVPDSDEPLGHEQHHEDDGERAEDQVQALRGPQRLGQDRHHGGPDEGPLEASQAAHHDHHQELDRAVEGEGAGIDVAEERREQRTADSRVRRADGEGHHLVGPKAHADDRGAHLVLADRPEGAAPARAEDPVRRDHDDGRPAQDIEVVGAVRREADGTP